MHVLDLRDLYPQLVDLEEEEGVRDIETVLEVALPLGAIVTARKTAVTIAAILPDRRGQVKCGSLARKHPHAVPRIRRRVGGELPRAFGHLRRGALRRLVLAALGARGIVLLKRQSAPDGIGFDEPHRAVMR